MIVLDIRLILLDSITYNKITVHAHNADQSFLLFFLLQIDLVHKLIAGMEDHITFNNKPKSIGNKNNPSLTVTLRKMSVKEKTKFNKQKNIEEHEHLKE